MKKYSWIMALVALMAFGFAGFAQEKPAAPAKPGKAPAAPAGPLGRMKDALQITPEQEAKLEAHRKAVAEQHKAFGEQMKKVREEMQALRKDGAKPDLNKTNELIDRTFKIRADQAKAMAKNRAEREKIFTPEQLEKMKPGRGLMGRNAGPGMGLRQEMAPRMGRPGMMMNRARILGQQGRAMMMNRFRMLEQRGRALMNRARGNSMGRAVRDRLLRLRRAARDWRWDED